MGCVPDVSGPPRQRAPPEAPDGAPLAQPPKTSDTISSEPKARRVFMAPFYPAIGYNYPAIHAARVRGGAVHEDTVRRPPTAVIEFGDEVEVANRHELDALPGHGEARRHVPGRDAKR